MAPSQFSGNNSNRANSAFTIGFFTILGAWAFQVFGGLVPCELCLGQRVPYYTGLPILALTIAFWRQIPAWPRIALTLIVAGIFVWGTWLGAYHAGVEWGFWPGPTACTGAGDGVDFSQLSDINSARVIPCDQVQFRFLGISLAGYNALISLIMVGFLLWSAWGQVRRVRAERA